MEIQNYTEKLRKEWRKHPCTHYLSASVVNSSPIFVLALIYLCVWVYTFYPLLHTGLFVEPFEGRLLTL